MIPARRLVSVSPLTRLRLSRLVESLRDPLAFGFDDLFDAIRDIAEHRLQVVALQLLLATIAQSLHEPLQARHILAVGSLKTPAEQPLHGAVDVAVLHQVLGHGTHQIVRRERSDLLGAVPTGITRAEAMDGHGVSPSR